ncbi:MAG: carbon-nitrogen hydrolase family protein [Aigarchaeota archaeon]|nr:carbon-nitrogen hydrolase family protein [Aigarchaeota archaeon]MDW8092372.1 carbon-nitrogen hydrolase family protein [Nitrososphaerota archaeon]
MVSLRLAALQVPVGDSPKGSIRALRDLSSQLSRGEVDLLVLPEAWTDRDPLPRLDEMLAYAGVLISELSEIACALSTQLYGGGIYVYRGGPRVGCPVIDHDGKLIGWQYKTHLFRDERRFFVPGEDFRSFTCKTIKVGVLICHDIVYPENARILALRGADLIVSPARIVSEGIKPWHIYLRARCLENRLPILASNVWIEGQAEGRSIVVEPTHQPDDIVDVRESVLDEEGGGLLISSVNIERPNRLRLERLGNRRPELYGDLCRDYQT